MSESITEPSWFMWQRGVRGPTPVVLSRRGMLSPALDEYEHKHKLGEPVKIPEEFAGQTLDALAARWPAPARAAE